MQVTVLNVLVLISLVLLSSPDVSEAALVDTVCIPGAGGDTTCQGVHADAVCDAGGNCKCKTAYTVDPSDDSSCIAVTVTLGATVCTASEVGSSGQGCADYVTNSECDTVSDPKVCVCSTGFEANGDNTACNAVTVTIGTTVCTASEVGSSGQGCADYVTNSECDTAVDPKVCVCSTGFEANGDNTACNAVTVTIGTTECTASEVGSSGQGCADYVTNSECDTVSDPKVCVCSTNFEANGDNTACYAGFVDTACTPGAGGDTTCQAVNVDTECNAGGKCTCKDTYAVNPSDSSVCIAVTLTIGTTVCTASEVGSSGQGCADYVTNSECDTAADPAVCVCSAGFEANGDNTACVAVTVTLGATVCTASEVGSSGQGCADYVTNSECNTAVDPKVCVCSAGFEASGDNIACNAVTVTIGATVCTASEVRSSGQGCADYVANSECNTAVDPKVCVCSAGFEANGDNTACNAVTVTIGTTVCTASDVGSSGQGCADYVTNSECNTAVDPKVCVCSAGFEANGDNTACNAVTVTLGTTVCTASEVGSSGQGCADYVTNSECNTAVDPKVCVCSAGFEASGDNTACNAVTVTIGATVCTASEVGSSGQGCADYVTNSECDTAADPKVCVCSTGFMANGDNTACITAVTVTIGTTVCTASEVGSSGQGCADYVANSECDTAADPAVCVCSAGTEASADNTACNAVTVTIGTTECTASEVGSSGQGCADYVTNSTCNTTAHPAVCVCSAGNVANADNTACSAVTVTIGTTECTATEVGSSGQGCADYVTNSECNTTAHPAVCACSVGSEASGNNTACSAVTVTIGTTVCTATEVGSSGQGCADYVTNSECDTTADPKVCVCSAGFEASDHNKACTAEESSSAGTVKTQYLLVAALMFLASYMV